MIVQHLGNEAQTLGLVTYAKPFILFPQTIFPTLFITTAPQTPWIHLSILFALSECMRIYSPVPFLCHCPFIFALIIH